ncbi:RNA polymerase sigma factor [Shigella sonnei]|nr:RNA polymerase sigma factor [Shigella sonnei]
MSQNTLKVHDLNEDAEFDENGVEVFDEKALVEEEPSDNDLAEEELLSQGATQRVLDATQLYLGEIGYSPLRPKKKFILRVAHCVEMSPLAAG